MVRDDEKLIISPELTANFNKQIAEAAAAYRNFQSGMQQVIENLSKQWAAFSDQLQQTFNAIAQIDWAEVDRRATQDLTRLAELGWTVAPWMTLPQVSHLSQLGPDDLDREFIALYFEGGGLRNAEHELTSSAHMQRWHPLLVQVFAALNRREHLIAVPALLLMLEGFIAQFADPNDLKLVCTTNVPILVKQIRTPEDEFTITTRLWASTIAFLSQLYKRAPFSEDRPTFLNRHWILHGRDETNWAVADALRVLNALGTLHWLVDTHARRANGSPKSA